MNDLAESIRNALSDKKPGLLDDARQILNVLEYKSDRTMDEIFAPDKFLHEFKSSRDGANERELRECAKNIGIIFQVCDEEIRQSALATDFQRNNERSFIFVAVDLDDKKDYPRWRLARMTRAVNRCFAAPAVVLFRHRDMENNDSVSLSFVYRRQSKTDSAKDVLGRVSILRAIQRTPPIHRGHLNILKDLALTERAKWMEKEKKTKNFDGLLVAWLNALDTETLNRTFYSDLRAWFCRAVEEAKFPNPPQKPITPESQVIRLITRLLFVWFIKEKGLVADDFFSREKVRELLTDFDTKNDGDYYYCAILQNLFFATLNTEINRRAFSEETRKTHRNFNLYRHAHMLANRERFCALAEKTPFVNGGLFDCMDSEDSHTSKGDEWRQDYFSDTRHSTPEERDRERRKSLFVPDGLFFGEEPDKEGIIDLLHRYKFTVEENTPLDQEVALDPELLGLVFENLLAAHNPETKELVQKSVRKMTGSFYTPRAVVDYMVNEALLAHFLSAILPDNERPDFSERLRELLSYEYDDDATDFSKRERDELVRAIANIRVLDPAAGSGAFPMGILQKLSLALSKLDPKNELWRDLQKARAQNESVRAYDSANHESRESRLLEINNAFERYAHPFGRKLFLIQNSIYGVDIQPTACQIAKLRVFISLAIEQESTDNKDDNYGIRPLPNLETRFVAADTLVHIPRMELRNAQVEELERKMAQNNERYFNARNRDAKLQCKRYGEKLRDELKRELQSLKFGDNAEKIAAWDPFDQNACAEWFDPEWMFYIRNGFDIVIGNPPYLRAEHLDDARKEQLKALYSEQKPGARKATAWVDDLYVHFIFRGYEFVRKSGAMTYIANSSFVGFKRRARVRRLFLANDLRGIVHCPPDTFGATIHTAIFLLQKRESEAAEYETGELRPSDYDYQNFGRISYETTKKLPDSRLSYHSPKLELVGRLLADFPNFGKSFSVWDTGIHSGNVRPLIFFKEKEREELSRLLQGRQIERWQIFWNLPSAQYKWCDPDYKPQNRLGIGAQGRPSRKKEYWNFCGDRKRHHLPERLLLRQTADNLVAAYHSEANDGQFYTDNTLFTVRPAGKSAPNLKYALALLNSRLLNMAYQFLAQEDGKALAQVKVGLVEALPLVTGTEAEIKEVVDLADKIIAAKRADSQADISEWESEIDRRVYALYGLTAAELQLVEGKEEPESAGSVTR